MMSTVICHFYNEQYLLPWWLEHHRAIFDHGILINYGSTDRSVEICERLVPDWQVLDSENAAFDALEVDREVMEVERQLPGWKMALNVTEFLCVRDFSHFLWAAEGNGVEAAAIDGVVVVEDPDKSSGEPHLGAPLVRQLNRGFFEIEQTTDSLPFVSRSRLLHRHFDGAYRAGRHSTAHTGVWVHPQNAFIMWMAYAPWSPRTLERKLQIQARIPASDLARGHGTHHVMTQDELLVSWRRESAKAGDLRGVPRFMNVMGAWPPH